MMKNVMITLHMEQFIETDESQVINRVKSFQILADHHDQKFCQISLHTYDFSDDFMN